MPFYVAAPLSTVDYSLCGGEGIPIEERNAAEVSHLAGLSERSAIPAAAGIYNPAFDVTPADLIAGHHHRGRRRPAALPGILGQWRDRSHGWRDESPVRNGQAERRPPPGRGLDRRRRRGRRGS